MASLLSNTTLKSLISEENQLFFKQWLKYPTQLGTFTPISLRLAHSIVDHLDITDKTTVVEIGAATGRLSNVLLKRGVNINRLAMVDLNYTMSSFLKNLLRNAYGLDSQLHVINGNAEFLPEIIPSSWVKKVDYVVSTIPLEYMDEEARERIIQAAVNVIHPETGVILHASYSPMSPVRFMEGELVQRRIASVWGNMPPGFIWRFSPKHYTHNIA